MKVLSTIAGILLLNAELWLQPPTFPYSYPEPRECPCAAWSTALPPGRRCDASSELIPLTCGAWVDIKVYSQAPDRLTPVRTLVEIRGHWKPGDIDMDGDVDRGDWIEWLTAGPYDFNLDGSVNTLDHSAVFAAMEVCP